MNIRDRRAIHHAAGQSLENAKGDPQQILLLYLGITTFLSLAVSAISVFLSNRIADTGGLSSMGLRSVLSTAKTVLPLLQSLIVMGLELGYCTMVLRVSRGESVSKKTLWSGFRLFFPLLRAQILQGILYFAIMMLCIYPSAYIFLMLPISEEFYEVLMPLMESGAAASGTLMLDEATVLAMTDAMMPMMWILLGLFLIPFIPLYYQFRMAVYRLIDQPRPGAMAAMWESRAMMRRNRFALFRLDLSLWWYYGLQALVTAVCYGDLLLPLAGVTLPWSDTANSFLFLALSLALQFVVCYFTMNRVSVTYAAAYNALLPKKQAQAQKPVPKNPDMPTNVPWQDQY